MERADRIYQVHRILRNSRVPVTKTLIQEKLECSRATVTRILREMRDYLGAPIDYDRADGGYRYAESVDGPYELPGLWFNASELHALLAAHQLLANAQPGLLEGELKPLTARIEKILSVRGIPAGDVGRRVRILRMASRVVDPGAFRAVADAVLGRRQMRFDYHGRARDETTPRLVSPQRLVHYRDNWYLDAWDHGRKALRSFSVDRIRNARIVAIAAKEVPEARLEEHFATAYGIFAGKPRHTAVLRFSAESARWVADEVWHPEQQGRFEDGKYILEIPYLDARELVHDILKHGRDVTVVAPPRLREEVERHLREALENYLKIGAEGSSPGCEIGV